MDFEDAIAAHVAWKIKLRGAITTRSQVDAVSVARDDKCVLGQWLHGDARQKYAHLAAFTGCVQAHAAVHREAGRVAALINAKQYTEAAAGLDLGSPYSRASMDATVAITRLRSEIVP